MPVDQHVHLASIGGSDVGAIMGVSSFNTPAKVWDRIMGLRPQTEEEEPTIGPLARGKALEGYAADMWQRSTRCSLWRCVDPVPHPRYPFMHGRYDRRITSHHNSIGIPDEDGILEVKVLGSWSYRKVQQEGISAEYMYQLQHYLACTGLNWGAFAVMNPDEWNIIDPHELVFGRNEEMIAEMEARIVEWWETYVLSGVRPPLTENDERVHPRAFVGGEEQDWSVNPEWNQACLALREAREQYTLAEHAKKLAEDRVKDMMGEHEVVRSIHGKITWREGSRSTVDMNALRRAHPEIDYSRYERRTVTRTFRPTFT